VILHDINIDVSRGDRIAFVGKNGEGKTTLAKMLVNEEPLTAGHVTIGHNVKIGYYAQQQAEKLDGNDTVFDTIDQRAKGEMRTKVRSLLGAFLFGGDDVDKKVKVLSGGEKSRVALACLLLEPYNVLVMDEPTNHLDMRSKEILKEALMNYNGTLIVVSHDRDFLQGLTNRLFYFRGGGIKEHIGDIDDFLSSQKLESLQELERKSAVKAADKAADKLERAQPAPTKPSNNGQPKPQRNAHEQKQLENKLKKLEKQVEESERKLKALEAELSNPTGLSANALQEKVLEYEKVKQQNAQLTKDWEAVVEEMEN
jgi:ATP-binding cassette subfamily F protein 3